MWDLESGQCLRVLEGHNSWVSSVSVTPDGRLAVSVSGTKRTPDGLARAIWTSGANTLRVWDLETGECLRTFEGHSDEVTSVSVMALGRLAVSGGLDRTLRVWNLQAGGRFHRQEPHGSGVEGLSVTPDSRRVVSIEWDSPAIVWDIGFSREIHTVPKCAFGFRLCRVALSSVGRALVGTYDGTHYLLHLVELESGRILRTIHPTNGCNSPFTSVGVDDSGSRGASSTEDGMLQAWDLETGECLRTLRRVGRVVTLTLTPDGRRIVTSEDGSHTLVIWDMESGKPLHILHGHNERVTTVSVMPDGRGAVSGSLDKTLRVWDMESGECLRVLVGHCDLVSSSCVTMDGQRVVSGSHDNTLRVWNLARGICLSVYRGSAAFRSVAIQRAENVICAGTTTGEVLFLELHCVPSGPAILTAPNL